VAVWVACLGYHLWG